MLPFAGCSVVSSTLPAARSLQAAALPHVQVPAIVL
jgi:hypothetical protein